MANRKTIAIALTGWMMILTGCDVKDPIYDNIPPPEPGTVTLTTDWSRRTDGIDIPATYTVVVDDRTLTFNTVTNVIKDLDPGTYGAYIYNKAEGIDIDGTTAAIQYEGNKLPITPEWFFTACPDITCEAGKDHAVTAPMVQQVRRLTIELTAQGGDPARISRMEAMLDGVAASLDFKTGVHTGNNLHLVPVFERNGNKITASVRLLGVTGSQKLTLKLIFTDDTDQTLEEDVTGKLAGFNNGKDEPLTLKADLNLPVEVGMEATITGWEAQKGSSGIAQ